MNPPCDYQDWQDNRITAACPFCRHTALVHPGTHNPGIAFCLLCQMICETAVTLETVDVAQLSGFEVSSSTDDSVVLLYHRCGWMIVLKMNGIHGGHYLANIVLSANAHRSAGCV